VNTFATYAGNACASFLATAKEQLHVTVPSSYGVSDIETYAGAAILKFRGVTRAGATLVVTVRLSFANEGCVDVEYVGRQGTRAILQSRTYSFEQLKPTTISQFIIERF
jgi:hypothetical protein